MRWVGRHLHGVLREASRAFPVVVLTGPRRAGKTALLRRLFPKAAYQLLESPDLVARVRADPRGWLEAQTTPIILDEIQHAPELLPYIRASVDAAPGKKGPLAHHGLAGLLFDAGGHRVDGRAGGRADAVAALGGRVGAGRPAARWLP